MSLVNIGGDQADKSYRYKMPPIQTKVEGRGNGIKTAIPNMLDVSRALHIDVRYPTKFFGIELGAQSTFDKKTDRAVVNGKHEARDLAVLLEKFIKLFILCPNCALPELNMKVRKEKIKIECRACGHAGDIPTNHKLVTYILKNPPVSKKAKGKSADDEAGAKKAKKEKKEKRDKKRSKEDGEDGDENQDDGPEDDENDGDDNGSNRDEEDDEAVSDEASPTAGSAAAAVPEANGTSPTPDDEPPKAAASGTTEWFTDTSDDAAAARKKAELAELKASESGSSHRPTDIAAAPPEDVLRIYITDNKRNVREIAAEIRRLQLSRGLDQPNAMRITLKATIDNQDPKLALKQVQKNCKLYATMTTSAEKDADLFIAVLEEFFGAVRTDLKKIFPHTLKALYEDDVLSEETIVRWYNASSEGAWLVKPDVARSLRSKAKPVVAWLQNADEDDAEDEN